jgi:two-component system sensor histidine kinase MtrB
VSEPRPEPRTPPGVRLIQARRAAGAPGRGVLTLWRRSLQLRTVTISVLLSAMALAVVGVYLERTIGNGLFRDRLDQVLVESQRATEAARGVLDSATSTDQQALEVLRLQAVVDDIPRTASTSTGVAMFATAENTSAVKLQPLASPDSVQGLVSSALQHAVASSTTGVHWQSVGLPMKDGGVRPGIVVGELVQVPSAGPYGLYLVYDIADVQSTLDLVQRTLLLGGIALELLIGAVTLFVVRLVVLPIRQAAGVSEELAAGNLERRIPERGQDVVATLARSFNRMADGLERQITQLANLSRVQQRFVSDVSHELRTPLTTIRLASDVLYDARDGFEPNTARAAELLRAQVQRFEALLADLLEISRMDAQAADLTGEPTNLVALTREAIDGLAGLAEETGTSVHLITPGGHVEVEVDSRRISRILRNLLANALEHGEGRPIVVTVDSTESAVAVGVRDHGVGMRAEDAQHVFDRFWRADPSRQRRIGGTGLGLAISLEDALLHGGTIEVWSRPGEGTNFVLTLPRIPGTPAGPSPLPLEPVDTRPVPTHDHGPRVFGHRDKVRT